MANRICILDDGEAQALARGEKPSCKKHRHTSREDAGNLCSGTQYRPWLRADHFKPESRWATLADGRTSRKHIIMHQSWEWRKVPSGGFSVMQLLSQSRSR